MYGRMALPTGGLRRASGVWVSRGTEMCEGLPAELGRGRKEKTTHAGRPPLWNGERTRTPDRVPTGCPSRAFVVVLETP
jgi:hypothetical protein